MHVECQGLLLMAQPAMHSVRRRFACLALPGNTWQVQCWKRQCHVSLAPAPVCAGNDGQMHFKRAHTSAGGGKMAAVSRPPDTHPVSSPVAYLSSCKLRHCLCCHQHGSMSVQVWA